MSRPDHGRPPPGEVGEVEAQGLQRDAHALAQGVDLVVPVVAGPEAAHDHPHHAGALVAGGDQPLGGERRRLPAGGPRRLRGEAARGVVGGDACPAAPAWASSADPPMSKPKAPPTCSSTRVGCSQELMPGPVAIASQTCSGVPGTVTSRSTVRGSWLGHEGSSSEGGSGVAWTPDESVGSPGRVVVAGGEVAHRRAELLGEGRPLGGRGERDLGVEGEGREALVLAVGAAGEVADLADHPAREGEQVARGEAVGDPGGVGGRRAEGGRGDQVRRRGRLDHPLGEPAPRTLPDLADQAVGLQRAQVVVDLLAGQADLPGQRRGRAGLGERGQQARAQRVQRRRRGGGFVDDVHVEHGPTTTLTKDFVNKTRAVR